MKLFNFDASDINLEIQEFNTRLLQGMQTLKEIDEIDVGVTDKELVYEEDKLKLYHYLPRVNKINKTPVLIIYALVNRPYMADLQDGRSLIQGLLDQGEDVYLIDWGYPDAADRYLSLSDYINKYINDCVDIILHEHGIDKLNIFGICQGGCFSLCYTSLYQDKVKNLIATVTPVNFHTPKDVLSNMVRHVDIDLLVDAMGNIPGEALNWTFLNLKPYALMSQKYIDLVNILDDKEKALNFMRMEKWIFDSPAQAGEAYKEFITQFYQENGFINKSINIDGKIIDLNNITIPVLNIYALSDHLVPPDSSKALGELLATDDYEELAFPGGHIGIYVSSKAQKMIPPTVSEWLKQRD